MKEIEYPFLVCPYCDGKKFVGWEKIVEHINFHFEEKEILEEAR